LADARVLRSRRLLNLRQIPVSVRRAVAAQLATEVDGLAAAMRRAAPVDNATQDADVHLRDSVHAYKTPGRPLSYRIIADAKDGETGNFIGPHVEAGHKARDGSHVPPRPFFFPTYRARKKGMKRRLSAAGRKAVKQLFPE
jgi:hypothetical protein